MSLASHLGRSASFENPLQEMFFTTLYAADQLFKSELKDWQTAIDHYLETGTSVQHHSYRHSKPVGH